VGSYFKALSKEIKYYKSVSVEIINNKMKGKQYQGPKLA